MKSVLEEFACGGITGDRVFHLKKDSRYERIMEIFCECEDKLTSVLDDEMKETLKQLLEAQSDSSLIEGTERFICGYRLGVLMTMEVFNGSDEIISGGSD
ncbi:MAG: hypothetical protein FWE20_06345 [Defluviitaleaceae bacterium]|nr:hypothetical protein [Defluviitaleaceae bacterium]